MADSQVQAQHEEHHASEKPVAENGANGHDEHASNGAAAVTTNGESKQSTDGSNGDSANVKAAEGAAEPSPAKPKRTASRVKDLFSRLFKRGKSKDASEQNQNGDTPKKEKAKKEKCGKKQQEAAANAADSTTTEKDAAQKAAEDHDGAKLAEQTDSKLKIEDCVDTNGHVDEKAKAEEKAHAGADEKAGDKCADPVGGDAEKHDC